MANLLVIGSTNTDLVVKTGRFPRPGETVLGGQFFQFPGGKGANQAVAAARLGGQVRFVTKVGDDEYGRQAVAGFQRENIRTDYIRYAPDTASGVAVILVDDQGENQIVVASGANARFTPAELTDLAPAFAEAELLLLQLELPPETIQRAIALAATAGKKVVLNPAPAHLLPDEVYPQLYAITPNESEAALLSGLPIRDETDERRAAARLRDRGVRNVVLTLGQRGCYYLGEAGEFHAPAPVVTAVDTTAAGDVFNGALAVALTEKKDWPTALAWASRAAARSVTRMGAQTSAPYRREID
jgi:ribokinase